MAKECFDDFKSSSDATPDAVNALVRPVLVILGTVVLVPACIFALYDKFEFQPHRGEIAAILDKTPAGETVDVPDLRTMMLSSLHDRTASRAARDLLDQLNVGGSPFRQLQWMLWTDCVSLHLSETEQLRIVLGYAYLGDGQRGFVRAARRLFNRSLRELTTEELATLVALERAPSAGPERIAAYRKRLVAALHRGT